MRIIVRWSDCIPGQLGDCWDHVRRNRRHLPDSRTDSWNTQNQRDADIFLEDRMTMKACAMLPKLLPVIGGEQDDCSVVHAFLFKPGYETSEGIVQIGQIIVVEVPRAIAEIRGLFLFPEIVMHIQKMEKGKKSLAFRLRFFYRFLRPAKDLSG